MQQMSSRLVKKAKTKSKLETIGNTLVKHDMHNLDIELEKSRSLFDASKIYSFLAPKVLSSNRTNQSISFEFIKELSSIRNSYLNYMCTRSPNEEDLNVLAKTGTVLAEIHEGLRIKNPVEWKPGLLFKKAFEKKSHTEFLSAIDSMPWSIAHCDYGFSNIHFSRNSVGEKELVILDPSANGFVTTNTNLRAPIYVDLANLISCIRGLVPIRFYKSIYWNRVAHVERIIVDKYSMRSGHQINQKYMDGMVYATAKSYFWHTYRFPFSYFALRLLFTPLKQLKTNL